MPKDEPVADEALAERQLNEALKRVLESDTFARSERLRLLLSHIVTATIEGRRDQLLGKNIATDLFGIDVGETSDLSSVRVEIGRLRARLKHYYDTEGTKDPVVIEIPKGAYSATFTKAQIAPSDAPRGRSARPGHVKALLRSARFLGVVAVVAVLALAAGALWGPWFKEAPLSERPLVAVAPIENLSGNPGYIASGLTADIVNRLARFDNLVVVSRAATAVQNRSEEKALSFGQRLNADYQLAGALHDDPDGFRLTLELLSIPGGEVVWVDEFFLPDTDSSLLTARLEAADAVARALASRNGAVTRLVVSGSDGDSAPDRAGYLCVLRFYAYLQRRDPQEHAAVRDCLEDATQTSPDYAEVWSSLAQVYLDERRNGFGESAARGDPLSRAFNAATRAVELAPDSASAHSVLGATQYFRRDLAAFRKAARRSLELNPNDPDARAYFGHLLSMSGSWDEGQRLLAEAMELSPIHPPVWHHSTAMAALREGNYERALREAELGEMPGFYMSYVLLAAIHGHLENPDGARDALTKLEAIRPAYLEAARVDLGRRDFQPTLVDVITSGLRKASSLGQ
ncbi:hypothetical protein [Marivita sp. XM-24bin2]|jgi:adenylate cyclase|uniref:tetratricopeptide repeat protein n=1 Tax=Marivita sp. XM-24bin2 TaxID=2133951 RepID=UPI0025BDF579|nr:hypothetical protein [Marivita sp. XM-24bin2]MCR9111492.1 hypothetical protein [Paracoccaceae bacterium]